MERRTNKLDKPNNSNKLGELGGRPEMEDGAAADLALEQVLKHFRMSVHAWSDAEYSRPRTTAALARPRSWRLAAGWALGCILVVGSLAGGAGVGLHERHHRLELARIAEAARAAEQQRLVREQQAREEEDLLAKVDSDVSRQVPSAMEPLAQLMDEK